MVQTGVSFYMPYSLHTEFPTRKRKEGERGKREKTSWKLYVIYRAVVGIPITTAV